MKKFALLALGFGLTWTGVAWAEDEPTSAEPSVTLAPTPDSAPVPAATPQPESAGQTPLVEDQEEVAFKRLVGFTFEGRGGAFLTLGGSRGYSNAEPYFGLEIGYDLSPRWSLQLAYGQGYQASNPLQAPDPNGGCSGPTCDYHLDFGMTFFHLTVDFDLVPAERWTLELKAGGGAVLIDPSAMPDQPAVDFDALAGLRFDYYTMLKHFTVGMEVDFIYVIQTEIPALAITCNVQYTF